MNDKVSSLIQKSRQECKRGHFGRALKRLEQGIASHPDELDLYLEAIDTALEGGELLPATNLLKTVQDKFTRERERVHGFIRDKLVTVHDASLARCVVEHAVKRRDLENALELLVHVPDHTVRDLLNRARTKAQSLKSATHGGYTVRGEAVSNEITNAILSVRLGNIKEAMATFVKVVEEKPIEHKTMDPFLATLAAKNPKSGRVRYARGCSLRAGGNEIDAIQHFVEGVRIEPACAASCMEQLRAMLDTSHHPAKVRRALAETLLIKGDHADAAQTLREYVAENPDNAREVIMLLRPFIEPGNGLNECTWLAVEQALGIEQSSVALEVLRGLHQHGGHGDELYAWLEERAEAGFIPTDVMLFHGSLALEQKRFERAAEILSAVCTNSPPDVPAVLSMIDRHRSSHESIEALYRSHASEEKLEETAAASSEDDFQSFEAGEFRLESTGRTAPAPSQPAADKPKPRFSSSPFTSSAKDGDAAAGKPSRKSFLEANELSFDDDGAVQRDGADDAVTTGEPVQREDGDDAMKPGEPTEITGEHVTDAATKPEEAREITEEHVTNVAQQLYLAGAAAFFHIDEGATGAADTAAADSTEDASPSQAMPPATAPASSAPEPVVPEPFETRYAKFSRGELSNTDVLVMLEEAVRDGRVDELHEMLYFEPETGAEHFARYYYQAEYHLLSNRPLQALGILARLDTPDLDSHDKHRVWYKIAVAQRMAHNYEGAANTLERLVKHFPDRDDLAVLKRRNHEQSIEEQSMAATTLEKTSSLD